MDNSVKLKTLEERAKRMNIDYVDISTKRISPELSQLININFARQNKLVPLELSQGLLTVAMENPKDLFILEQLEVRTKNRIKPVLADTDDIMKALKSLYSDISLEDITVPLLNEGFLNDTVSVSSTETIDWLYNLLANAFKRSATDVHVEVYDNEIKVRYRIDGIIAETLTIPSEMETHVNVLLKSLSGMKLEKKLIPQRGFFEVLLRGHKVIVRVETLPVSFGERFILKFTDEKSLLRYPDELGFYPEDLKKVKEIVSHRQGLIIVASPAGNGISTTLYSLLLQAAKPELVTITVEDPIETSIPGVNQLEVNQKMDMGYEVCLRAALRHIPDILMLSRTREPEVARLIVEAALTGHLTFAGLHASNSIDAITRLRDFGIEPYFLSNPLLGIIAQRLARTVCPYCSEPVEASPELMNDFKANKISEPYDLREGKGCSQCLYTGFRGRIGVYEVLTVSESFKAMILRGSSKFRLQEQAQRDGMRTLLQDGLEKVAKGLTTYNEIKRVLID
jgi:type II secretory ATPase GspE/PulE/Tfp pilus assembly ATPase PilB-like protein